MKFCVLLLKSTVKRKEQLRLKEADCSWNESKFPCWKERRGPISSKEQSDERKCGCYPKRATSLPLSLSCKGSSLIPRPAQSSLYVPFSFLTSERIEPSNPCSQAIEDKAPSPSLSSHAPTSSVFHFCASYEHHNNTSTVIISCI